MRAIAKRLSCLLGVALIAAAVYSPSSSFAWEWVAGPPITENRPWKGLRLKGKWPAGERTIRIATGAGYCAGEAPPLIHHVDVEEEGKRVVIKAYVQWPEPMEVSGPVMPGEPSPGCAGLMTTISKRIKLGQPRKGVELLDGFYSPPRKVAVVEQPKKRVSR